MTVINDRLATDNDIVDTVPGQKQEKFPECLLKSGRPHSASRTSLTSGYPCHTLSADVSAAPDALRGHLIC